MKFWFFAPLFLFLSSASYAQEFECYRASSTPPSLLPHEICLGDLQIHENKNQPLTATISYSLENSPLQTITTPLELLQFELHYTMARIPLLDREQETAGSLCENYEKHLLGVRVLLTPDNRLKTSELFIDARSYWIDNICKNDQVTGTRTEYSALSGRP